MAISEILPSSVKIDKLVHRIEEGDIKVPAFQRGFVWSQGQVISLLDSIYNDYPIGSVLLWSTSERLHATRNVAGYRIPDRKQEYPVNYVLDGQQRLSTIYAVFCTERNREDDPYAPADPEIFDVHFDLETESFRPSSELVSGNKTVRLNQMFDVNTFLGALQPLSPQERELASKVQSQFNNYEIPTVTITRREKSQVGTIFERINNSGTDLSTLDLMVAWTWTEDFQLRDQVVDLIEDLDAKGFADLQERIVLQCLSAIVRQSTTTATMLSLTSDEVRANFDGLRGAIARSVDFLATQLRVTSRDFLPHAQQVVGLTSFFAAVKRPSAEQTKALKDWFWKTSFSRRYSAQTDEKMDEDIALMGEIAAGRAGGVARYPIAWAAVELMAKFTRANPFTRAFLLLLAQKQPKDLTNGNDIDLTGALSSYNSHEYHHVFPRAFLRGRPVRGNVNAIANYCFLPAASNKLIADRAPSDYVRRLIPQRLLKQILESNVLPTTMERYDNDEFDVFLVERAQITKEFMESLVS